MSKEVLTLSVAGGGMFINFLDYKLKDKGGRKSVLRHEPVKQEAPVSAEGGRG
jgi:hypothetical protein